KRTTNCSKYHQASRANCARLDTILHKNRFDHAVTISEPRATTYGGLTMFDSRADNARPITPPLSSKWSVRAGMTRSRWFQAGGRRPGPHQQLRAPTAYIPLSGLL